MKTRQFKDAYKITHSCIDELASYLNRGWPECVGERSIQEFLVSFTEDLPEPLNAKNAILVTVAETEREAIVILRDCIKKQGEKLDEARDALVQAFGSLNVLVGDKPEYPVANALLKRIEVLLAKLKTAPLDPLGATVTSPAIEGSTPSESSSGHQP